LKSSLPAAARHASTVAQKRKHRDPYTIAQAKARKAANLSRRAVLQKERAAKLGDPVRGITTPFVASLERVPQVHPDVVGSTVTGETQSASSISSQSYLNFSLSSQELQASLQYSEALSAPLSPTEDPVDAVDAFSTPSAKEDVMKAHARAHQNATEALTRITALSNASAKDRLRANVARCIDAFGRHNTIHTLPPRNAGVRPHDSDHSKGGAAAQQPLPAQPRAGPDTGSSEVQIAILTVKIRALAKFLESRGRGDKMNKRNLRVLVHKRQKLLQYLRKKERGGPRWKHCIETLGLTEGTWQGEISL
jgi:ribosomal protein S15